MTKKIIFIALFTVGILFLFAKHDANALIVPPPPPPAPAGIPVEVNYDNDYYINTYIYQPLARILISKISNSLQNSLLDKIGATISDQAGGGKDPHFVTDWRNLILNSQARGTDTFRSVLADTNLCSYFSGGLKQVFGADLFGGVIKNLGSSGSLTNAPGTGSFQYLNKCSLSSNVDVAAFSQDFNKGGWSAWLQLLQPENNPLGAYVNSLSEQSNQTALAQKATEDQAIAYQGALPNLENSSNTTNSGGACTTSNDCPTGQTCSGGIDSGGSGNGTCVSTNGSSATPTPIPKPPSASGCASQGLLTRCTVQGKIVTPGSLFNVAAQKRFDQKLESLNLNGNGIDNIEALILLVSENLLKNVGGQLDNLLSNTKF